MLRYAIPAILGALLLTAPLAAQSEGRGSDSVPPGHRPPPGMCRIWIDGVPPGQQAAPTDCATAIRNRPANGRVVFGDEYTRTAKKKKLLPSGLFGGKDEKVPVKKLRDDGDSDNQRTESPKAQTQKSASPRDSVEQKKDPKKSGKAKAKKPAEKSII